MHISALYVVGAVLIMLGTLASTVAWLAVLGMAVVGFLVLFSGVLSAAIAGGDQGRCCSPSSCR